MKSYLLVALAIALLAAAPLTYPGPLQTQVGFSPLYALMGDAYAEQSLGALPLGASRALMALAVSPVDALKAIFGAAFVIGALGMFLLGSRANGAAGGLIAASVYSLLPYRLMTTYVRGEPGEALFLGLLPLLGAAIIVSSDRWFAAKLRPGWAGLAVPALALALMAVVLWRLCVPFAPDDSQAEAHLFQIFSAQWDAGGGIGWLSASPMQLGVAPLGLGIAALVTRRRRRNVVLAAVAALAVMLSIVPFSGWWPWSRVLNEPWSLLGIAGLCLSLLAAELADAERGGLQLPLLSALVTFVVLASYAYLLAAGTGYTPTRLPLARFDDSIYLIAADTPPLQAGNGVTVTLLWQDIAPLSSGYKVFVHAIDAQNKVWAQRDAEPLDGLRPTSTWRRGELLHDPYNLFIPANAPSGLVIEAGLYRLDSGERFRTAEGTDRIVIIPRAP